MLFPEMYTYINLYNSDICDILQEYFRGLYDRDPYPRYLPSFQQPPYPFRPTPMPRGLESERGDPLFTIYRTLPEASPLPPNAPAYLMVIGGSIISPNFASLEPNHDLPLCLRKTFKTFTHLVGRHRRPPLIALLGDLQLWKNVAKLLN